MVPKGLELSLVGLEIIGRIVNIQVIVKIGLNTPESPVDRWELTVTQTPMKDNLLMQVRKTCKDSNNSSYSGATTANIDYL